MAARWCFSKSSQCSNNLDKCPLIFRVFENEREHACKYAKNEAVF